MAEKDRFRTGTNYLVWFMSHLLFDKKFMAMFSMLFGAGICLMAERRDAAGLSVIFEASADTVGGKNEQGS